MQYFTILATAALAALSSASPEPIFGRSSNVARAGTCMSLAEAQQVTNNFENLVGTGYSDTLATEAMAEDFNDYSDSVTSLIDAGCTGPQPLGVATFTSRAEFMVAQSQQPPLPFQLLSMWYNCDTVFIHWKAPLPPQQVTGIIVIETTPAPAGGPYSWLIQTVYSEFNSGAWLVDVDTFVPSNCTA
ncbi:hypothetical protein BAUCODRAFT_29926 [Baudoinia panamericana UAMH 10762]|uniref:NTF2-like domain-containing protein n=1 Tax=Baudoinia panamericana (strain UAMH 10762) TaxID=717646 RepID=M2NKC5_BAUPA|nr:uncharacterized protein BAUCODRAFT_29926 [Baudoinia panamericana UAMH 10762]EMC99560.1 hypothetical protein BAUCODRAFT_29926 [Baudoinia panamericana UAMH 10762]